MKKIVIAVLLIIISSAVNSKTVWKNRNLFSSSGNLKVGDILSVKVQDISDMKFDIRMKNTSSSDVASNPDLTITGFLPKIKSDSNLKNNSNTNFEEKGKVNFSIAAVIERDAPGGKFFLTGAKTYIFNGVLSSFSVTGIVDPVLIKGRAVDSSDIANFQINISVNKSAIKLNRNPLQNDEQAAVKISEEEKQKIIFDYIEKMLSEMEKR